VFVSSHDAMMSGQQWVMQNQIAYFVLVPKQCCLPSGLQLVSVWFDALLSLELEINGAVNP
jgi:hypothetical protein